MEKGANLQMNFVSLRCGINVAKLIIFYRLIGNAFKCKFSHLQGFGHSDSTSMAQVRGVPPKSQQHGRDWDVTSAQDWDPSMHDDGYNKDAYRDHPNSRTPQPFRKYTPIDKVSI